VGVFGFAFCPNRIDLVLKADNPQHLALTLKHLAQLVTRAQAGGPAPGAKASPWEGRFRAGALDDAATLQALWSIDHVAQSTDLQANLHSAAHWQGLVDWHWLATPPALWTLGNTPFARQAAYTNQREAFWAAQGGDSVRAAETLARQGWAQGSADWLALQEAVAGVNLTQKPPGRPRLHSVPNLNIESN
jgi:putative transposase